MTPEAELDFDVTVVVEQPLALDELVMGRCGCGFAWAAKVTFVGDGDAIAEVARVIRPQCSSYDRGVKLRLIWDPNFQEA